MLEALSAGVPVVCSDLAQVRSAFGDAVAYADGDVGNAVTGVLDGGVDVELVDQFRWERTVEATTAVLESLDD